MLIKVNGTNKLEPQKANKKHKFYNNASSNNNLGNKIPNKNIGDVHNATIRMEI